MKFRPSHPHVKKKNCKAWLASDNTSQIAQIVAHIQDLSVIFFFWNLDISTDVRSSEHAAENMQEKNQIQDSGYYKPK